MKKSIILSIAIMGILALSACGKQEPTIDTAPFEASVVKYLNNKHMEMKVSKMKNIKITDNQATATCSMKHKTLPGPAVQWKFTFTKKNKEWEVSNCKR